MGIAFPSRYTAVVRISSTFGSGSGERTFPDEDSIGTRFLNDLFREIGSTVLRLVMERKRLYPNEEVNVIVTVKVASVERPEAIDEPIDDIPWNPIEGSFYQAISQSSLRARIFEILGE